MKLNLGSGPEKGVNGWTNIDLGGGADLAIDLTNGIPFANNSIAEIYTSHFLEHLSYDQINPLLLECHRVLEPNAKLLVCVPNCEAFIHAYHENDYILAGLSDGSKLMIPRFLYGENEHVYAKAMVNTGSKIDWLNYIAYSANEHKYMFDKENLRSHLLQAGFESVCERDFDPILDKGYGENASIFFHGIKVN